MKKVTALVLCGILLSPVYGRSASVKEEASLYPPSPDQGDQPIAQLPEGESIEILEIPGATSPDRGWLYVKTPSQEGWISKKSVRLDEEEQYQYNKLNTSQVRFSIEGGAFKNISQSGSIRPRYALNVDFFLPSHWVLGGVLDSYRFQYGSTAVSRSNLLFSAGYELPDTGVTLRAFAGFQTTRTSGFDSSTTTAGGFSIAYRKPLSRKWDFGVDLIWQHFPKTTLTHDTGQPSTTDPITNSFCTLITLGFSDGCGNQLTRLTIPKSDTISLNVSFGFLFF